MRPDRSYAPPSASVLIDGSCLTNHGRTGGMATYVRNLLTALGQHGGVRVGVLAETSAGLPAGVSHRTIRRRSHRARAQVIEHAVLLPLDVELSRSEYQVFHNPGFHAPFGVRGTWVQTLHDVIPMVFDSPDVAALGRRWKRFGPRYRQADAVIAISRHAADEGIRRLGLDARNVFVAHHGVDRRFSPGEVTSNGPPYLLVVGEYSRRKGFGEAFALMDGLADAGYPHRLKVAGRVHEWGRDEVDRLRARSSHPDRIELLDFVPDLVALYRGASALLMCSRYEGFGFPVLEAMACGTPVVAFSNSALTEVAGDGGQLVDDGDVGAMGVAVRRLLDRPSYADEWRQRGLAHAARFTWERSAATHAEVYRYVAERVH